VRLAESVATIVRGGRRMDEGVAMVEFVEGEKENMGNDQRMTDS
jgi:hypothetical protein